MNRAGSEATLMTEEPVLSANMPRQEPAIGPWHSLTSQQCLQRLSTRADGLTRQEAAEPGQPDA